MNDSPPVPNDFDAASIKVLHWPDCARMRPEMYVGDVRDGSGLHYLVELVVTDALARQPSRVVVTLHADGAVTVADDGAPFPSDAERALSHPMMYDPGHLALASALSSHFALRLWRDDEEHLIRCQDGRVIAPTTLTGSTPPAAEGRVGAEATYLASTDVFGAVTYDRDAIARRLSELRGPEQDVEFRVF